MHFLIHYLVVLYVVFNLLRKIINIFIFNYDKNLFIGNYIKRISNMTKNYNSFVTIWNDYPSLLKIVLNIFGVIFIIMIYLIVKYSF